VEVRQLRLRLLLEAKKPMCLSPWSMSYVKSGSLLPSRKQMKQAINQLSQNRDVANLYLEDWG